MRFLALVNSISGAHEGAALASELAALQSMGKFSGEILPIDLSNSAQQLESAKAFDALLVVGGDGTVSRLLPYLERTQLPFGIVPLGTGNDFARELGVLKRFRSLGLESFLAELSHAHPREFKIGAVSFNAATTMTIPFCNYLSFGFDAQAVDTFSRIRERARPLLKRFGRFGNRAVYGAAGLRHLLTRLPSAATISNLDRESSEIPVGNGCCLIISNIRSYTGLGTSNSEGTPFDEKLECMLVPSPLHFAKVLCGGFPIIERGSAFRFRPGGTIQMQVDGEPMGAIDSDEILISCSGTIRVLAFDS